MDAETIAALQGEIDALREQLGLEADDDLSDSVSDLQGEVANLKQQVQDAADAEAKAEAEAERKAMAATGKALKAALGDTPLTNLRADSTATPALHSLTSAGLAVGIPNADNSDSTASPRMKAGASAGALGDWAGTNYAHKNAGTGDSNSAVVYTNQDAAKSYPIAVRYAVVNNRPDGTGDYTAAGREVVITAGTENAAMKGAMFPTAGSQTYTHDDVSGVVTFPGTYQGASGSYRCSSETCSAAWSTAGITVPNGETWVFVHDVGAMVSVTDATYLYFGWWLQKDKTDKPTSASAFNGVVGTLAAPAVNPNAIAGSATYSGHAAGKFANSDPINGGDGGHFTANATLNATFGNAATAGISGTIDNFMANDQAVPWSVSLLRRGWGTDSGTTAQPAADNPDTIGIDESEVGTVWSIDGNSAAASGTWTANVHDEKPGDAPAGDGSDVPTSVTGTFQSDFGSTHTMVGAFGATAD